MSDLHLAKGSPYSHFPFAKSKLSWGYFPSTSEHISCEIHLLLFTTSYYTQTYFREKTTYSYIFSFVAKEGEEARLTLLP